MVGRMNDAEDFGCVCVIEEMEGIESAKAEMNSPNSALTSKCNMI